MKILLRHSLSLLVLFSLVLLGGCKSSRYLSELNKTPEYSSAKFTPGGIRLDMCRDNYIIARIVPLGLAEIVRAEITPAGIVLYNRLAHWYMEMDYKDIPHNGILKVDFETVQGLVSGQAFSKVKKKKTKEGIYWENNSGYRFYFDSYGQLSRTERALLGHSVSLEYDVYEYSSGKVMPTNYYLTYTGKDGKRHRYEGGLNELRISSKPATALITDRSGWTKKPFNPDLLKELLNY